MAGRSQSRADHRTLHKLKVTGRRVALDGEILLEVTGLEVGVGDSGVTHDSILEFGKTVGEVHIEFSVPVVVDLSLDSKTGTPDAGSVTDRVRIVRGSEEDCSVGLGSDIEPELVTALRRFQYQDSVLRFDVQDIGFDGHTVLVVLDRLLLGIHCTYRKQRHSQN